MSDSLRKSAPSSSIDDAAAEGRPEPYAVMNTLEYQKALEADRSMQERDQRLRAQGLPTGRTAQEKEEKKERIDVATRLVQISQQDGEAVFFKDQRADAYVHLCVNGHPQMINLDDKAFGHWLTKQYYDLEGKTPAGEAVKAAVSVLKGNALFGGGPTYDLELRVAWRDGEIWYDLGDEWGRAVRITKQGWQLVHDPPILFRRYSHMKGQDTPSSKSDGTAIDALLDLMNLSDEDRTMTKVELGVMFIPGISHMIDAVNGPQGSGKTNLIRMIKMLVDPSEQDAVPVPRNDEEFIRLLDRHYVVPFDNVRNLNRERSDTLCQAVTGASFSKRKLYTDDEDFQRKIKRVVLLNGVNAEVKESDLLDRTIIKDLPMIDPGKRRSETKMWAEFYRLRPKVLAEIFDKVSVAMNLKESLQVLDPPRMVDWYEWAVWIGAAFGIDQGRFAGRLQAYVEKQHQQAIDQDTLAQVLISCLGSERTNELVGTPTTVHNFLCNWAEDERVNTHGPGWPKNPSEMGQQLNRLKQDLLREGISILDCHFSEIAGVKGMRLIEDGNKAYRPTDRIKIITKEPERFKGLRNGKNNTKRGPV